MFTFQHVIANANAAAAEATASRAASNINVLGSDVGDLKHQVGRLMLLNQALWELLQERTGLTEADLLARAEQIDLRDGKLDGKLSEHPVRCPQCSRVNSSRHQRCLYCGQHFQGDIFASSGR